jgi:hypothetical protein
MGEAIGSDGHGGLRMNPLARLDLSQFRVDSESFVGQALDLGVRFNKLEQKTADSLLVYLRLKGTELGKKNRTGIAITNELLTRAVRQVLACIDLGLRDLSEGDLNKAVAFLQTGDYEAFRKKGYEIAYYRLEQMKDSCRLIAARPESAFLPEELAKINRWASLAPESWLCEIDDEEETQKEVDPRKDFDAYRELKARMDFLRTVPWNVLERLKEAVGEDGSFAGLLRNLILSLALDKSDLLPEKREIDAFRQTCFVRGGLRENIRDKILGLVEQQLSAEVEEEFQASVLVEVKAELAAMENISEDLFANSFMVENSEQVLAE